MIRKKRGFTLIELLVVILIIGVLTAVAMPMYKRAVLKSRFTTVMPMAKAVADAQEVYFLGNGQYALDKAELDITPVEAEHTAVALSTAEEEEKYAYVAASNSQVPGARYIMYQKNSPMFANTIHCEADENNADALWLCEKGLGGTEIPGSVNTAAGEYKTFLLAGTPGSDTLPTSLNKLAANLCAGKTNCTSTVNEDTVVTTECTGTANNKTCVQKTYNDTGAQIDYRRDVTGCTPFKNNAYTNAFQCRVQTTDNEGHSWESETRTCDLTQSVFQNGECLPSSTGSIYEAINKYDTEGNRWRHEVSCTSSSRCTDDLLIVHNGQQVGHVWCTNYSRSDGMCSEIYNGNAYWDHYTEDWATKVSRTTVSSQNDTVTFTTTDTQTNQVTNTVTCAMTNADWDSGTCKTGTAI